VPMSVGPDSRRKMDFNFCVHFSSGFGENLNRQIFTMKEYNNADSIYSCLQHISSDDTIKWSMETQAA
jgi:hypothetical protein